MVKLVLLFALLCSGSASADAARSEGFDARAIRQNVAAMLEEGQAPSLALVAFDEMFAEAERQLTKAGRPDEAERLAAEWEGFGQEYLMALADPELTDVGDHSPFSEWIAVWYAQLEAVLGVQIMEMTHLRDIWVLNYTLPVVFRPHEGAAWCLDMDGGDCEAEYRRHFAGTKWQKRPDPDADEVQHHGFAGVVTYWAVWGGCTAATSGVGSLFCGPAGTGAEFVMERYVAPGLSDRIYARGNFVDGCDGVACEPDGCNCGDECDCDECDCEHCEHDAEHGPI